MDLVLVHRLRQFEIGLTANFTGSVTGSGKMSDGSDWQPNEYLEYSALGLTRWFNGFAIVEGIRFELTSFRQTVRMPSVVVEDQGYTASVSGIGTSSVTVSGATWDPSLEAKLIGDFWVYADRSDFSWLTRWENVVLHCNGTTASVPDGSMGGPAGRLTSDAVPLFGIPLEMSGEMSVTPFYGADLPGWRSNGTATDPLGNTYYLGKLDWVENQTADLVLGGGYRWRLEDGTVYAPPTAIPAVPAATGGPYGLNLSGIVTSTATWGNQITLKYRQTLDQDLESATSAPGLADYPADPVWGVGFGWKDHVTSELAQGSIMILPNVPPSLGRMNDGYSALLWRGGVPRIYTENNYDWSTSEGVYEWLGLSGSNWTAVSGEVTDGADEDTIQTTVRAARSQYIDHMTNAVAPIEDGLGEPNYCGVTLSRIKSETRYDQISRTGRFADTVVKREENAFDFRVAANTEQSEPTFGELSHFRLDNKRADWTNFQLDRLKGLVLSYPPNFEDGDPVSSDEWPVQGQRANPRDHWRKLHQQWIENAGLPAPKRTKRRNVIITEPVGQEPFGSYIQDHIFGNDRTSWVGSRFIKYPVPTSPASVQISSSSTGLYSISPATCTFTASSTISVDSGGLTSVDLLIDAGSFTIHPYMYGHISNRIQVLTTSNVASVEVFFRDVMGDDAAAVVEAGGWFKRPLNPSADNFAGSWAVEKNQGVTAIDDLGVDKNPPTGGISSATMSDAERAFAFGLNRGRTCAKFVIRLTPTNPAAPMVIQRPTYERAPGQPSIIVENVQSMMALWPNGPGVRCFPWSWIDPDTGAVRSEPEVYPPGSLAPDGWRPSIADMEISIGLVFRAIGPNDPSHLTRLKAMFDENERGTDDALVFKKLNYGTHGFIWDGHVHLVANVPPSLLFPGSNVNDLGEELEAPNSRYDSLCMGPRYFVSANQPMHIRADGTTTSLSVLASGPSGWAVTKFDGEVDNDELPADFEMVSNGTAFANMTPWHGYFAIFNNNPEPSTGGVSTDWHRDGRFWRACVDAGKVMLERKGRNTPYELMSHSIDADGCAVRVEKHNAKPLLWLYASNAGALNEYYSNDSGVNLTMATTISSTDNPRYPMPEVETDGVRYLYWIEDGSPATIKGLIRDKAGNTLFNGTVMTGVDDSPGSVRKTMLANGTVAIYLQVRIGGSLVEYVSTDGRTFA